MKIVLVVALLGVLVALAGAGLMMLKRPGKPRRPGDPADARMARALAIRVAISVALFVLILLAWQLGWISPQGVPLQSR